MNFTMCVMAVGRLGKEMSEFHFGSAQFEVLASPEGPRLFRAFIKYQLCILCSNFVYSYNKATDICVVSLNKFYFDL